MIWELVAVVLQGWGGEVRSRLFPYMLYETWSIHTPGSWLTCIGCPRGLGGVSVCAGVVICCAPRCFGGGALSCSL
jgi:hypothetical protein